MSKSVSWFGFLVLAFFLVGCDSSTDETGLAQLEDSAGSRSAVADSADVESEESDVRQEVPVMPEGEAEDGGLTISQIMVYAHDSKLFRRMYEDQPDPAVIEALLTVYQDLAKREPPLGDVEAWNEKTSRLIRSVHALSDGEDDALAQFKRAVNCNSCHSRHRAG
ncbi:MAG: hypothetical protein AAF802_29885 [Planctomycetota bacterium]